MCTDWSTNFCNVRVVTLHLLPPALVVQGVRCKLVAKTKRNNELICFHFKQDGSASSVPKCFELEVSHKLKKTKQQAKSGTEAGIPVNFKLLVGILVIAVWLDGKLVVRD